MLRSEVDDDDDDDDDDGWVGVFFLACGTGGTAPSYADCVA